MKERPILLNGEMVRAILEGRRRVLHKPLVDRGGKPTSEYLIPTHIFCPFGQPGDRLWVREA